MWFLILFVLLIFLDLYSKNLAYNYLQEKINILGDFLFLKYTENTWIAFSIQLGWFFLKILTIILIIWIIIYFFKYEYWKKNKLLNLSFVFILSWAIANWFERIFYWKVIDFIWVKYFSVFNLADSFITIWAILYFYFLFFIEKNK
jgi:signal peptidase II